MINKISFILFSLLFFGSINFVNAQNLISLPLSDSSYSVVFNANNNKINIVALGEFTHGGAEVFSFKSSVSKFLIKEKKFRTLFFEYDDPSLRQLNAFIQNGKIDNEKLLAIFKKAAADTPLACAEIFELISWIKD